MTESLVVNLPDDVLSVVTRSLSPRDICNLGLTCRSLNACLLGSESEKVWSAQCESLQTLAPRELATWREAVISYKALCRFLWAVKPLMGLWVHQNPELGNVVYVVPGFVSAVGCRVIPQELRAGPILWAPVFEVVGDSLGRTELFLLHGREEGTDFLYPGSLGPVHAACNVLLLEIGPAPEFGRLAFSDRRKLLETVTGRVRSEVPEPAVGSPFPSSKERWSKLVERLCPGKCRVDWEPFDHHRPIVRKTLRKYFRDGISQLLGKSNNVSSSNSSEAKQAALREFLSSGETMGLSLRAMKTKLSSYRAWPNMHESRFALYKLPLLPPEPGHELAGLWGGTFGWPPGQHTDDHKPAKPLFFLVLSYEQSEEEKKTVLIATKILEGTHYVLHPNGSAMFMVEVDEPSDEPFPWETPEASLVERSFSGEGIANGYGFRYPGSKPGSLFVFENGGLAFAWKESRVVLTLQRLDLKELLGRGERVPALPPIANFSYLTKSYSNVFAAAFTNSSNSGRLRR